TSSRAASSSSTSTPAGTACATAWSTSSGSAPVPLLRTVLHPAAGALGVPVRTFTLWQIVGGVLWSQSFVLAGYALGSSFSGIDHYLLPLVGVIVVLSLLPLLAQARRRR
ncbi:hypothetical protein ABZ372_47755, partial [Streptomyces sp. NPDC005921]